MRKQDDLTKRIYETLSLYYRSVRGVYQSDNSRTEDQRNGLNGIALELARGELEVARFFCLYDGIDSTTCSVQYPRDFDTRTDTERVNECKELSKMCDAIPSLTAKKVLLKRMANNLLVNYATHAELSAIGSEIDGLLMIVSSFDTIKMLLDAKALTSDEARSFFSGGK